MAKLYYELASEDELDQLWLSDEGSAALIEELLWQFEENDDLLEFLCQEERHARHVPDFEVKRFQSMWRSGYTVYILKIWPEAGRAIHHRVLYAHHPQKNSYHVLKIMQRDLNYEADKELIYTLITACKEIGIPAYR